MSSCITDYIESSTDNDLIHGGWNITSRLLIIDGAPQAALRILRQVLSSETHDIDVVCTAAAAIEQVRSDRPDVILLDPHLPDRCGLDLHQEIRRLCPHTPVIFLSAILTADVAIRAMKQGAFDCLTKPIQERQLQRVIADAFDIAAKKGEQPVALAPVDQTGGAMAGNSLAMRNVYKSIGRVAAQDVNVLVTGESGTGKELVARAIHQHSARAKQPFLALNCAAIPENLLESELFGHERGAFSGADRRRIGKFEQCNGGTILLDEIGDMPLNLQAKILRLLQEQTFERIGGNETIRTNVRIIASTHRDLHAWSAQEKFRADLYYRLSVFTIHLPPLRERGEDLPMLVRHFVRQYSQELDRAISEVASETMERLTQYHWPGNIRELQSVLKQAILRGNGSVLLEIFLPPLLNPSELQHLQDKMPADKLSADPLSAPASFDLEAFLEKRLTLEARDLYADIHRELDRESLARVLTFTRGNQHMASRVLGIARQTLRGKLRECGLQVRQSVAMA